MLWEFSQIRETYGWEVANLAKSIDARVSVGFMDMEDELGEEMYNMYHLHVSSNKLNITRDSIVAQLGLHFDMRNYCTHDFDCCGCWSRKRIEVANPHSREGVSYWIIDKWHKNI